MTNRQYTVAVFCATGEEFQGLLRSFPQAVVAEDNFGVRTGMLEGEFSRLLLLCPGVGHERTRACARRLLMEKRVRLALSIGIAGNPSVFGGRAGAGPTGMGRTSAGCAGIAAGVPRHVERPLGFQRSAGGRRFLSRAAAPEYRRLVCGNGSDGVIRGMPSGGHPLFGSQDYERFCRPGCFFFHAASSATVVPAYGGAARQGVAENRIWRLIR